MNKARIVSVGNEKPAAVNCFTIGFDGIGQDARYVVTEGILGVLDSSFGPAIPVGNDRGKCHLVLTDRDTPPMFSAVDGAYYLFEVALIEKVSRKTGRWHHFFAAGRADDDCIVVKVQTGHDGVVSFSDKLKKTAAGQKCSIETAEDGSVKHIASGFVVSRANVMVSKEYLFRLCEGGTIAVSLANGWKRQIAYRDGHLAFNDTTHDDVIASAWALANGGTTFNARNSGRHRLLDLMKETGYDLWDDMFDHLRGKEADVSIKVLERTVCEAPQGSDLRVWALETLKRHEDGKRAFGGKKAPAFVHQPTQSADVVQIKGSGARMRREKNLAERRARDQTRHAQIAALPRPGEALNNFQKKKGKK